MFYRLIEQKRNEWYASAACSVTHLVQYIESKGYMRDSQLGAIKTYLFLKIACGNRPLWELFAEGWFNRSDWKEAMGTYQAHSLLSENPAAAALLEYACLEGKNGMQVSKGLQEYILQNAPEIDFRQALKNIFYGVTYTDYLFSLPMGAGKTFLMAAFIYLDLYFALQEPQNKAFAHNFIVLAPSGLKSSIVPSLRSIKDFDPSWVVPEPAAAHLRQMVCFEVLDEQKASGKSNRIKNPNARKLANHEPFGDLMGLVAITNAEKVILDRMGEKDLGLFSEAEISCIRQANELRRIVGSIPHLAVLIDEVHHAADGEIKLRQAVEQWTREHSFTGVLGFSGTPYLEKPEKVEIGGGFSIKSTDLANVVYHYPLARGIGNFLKIPVVRYLEGDAEDVVRQGVGDFLNLYGDTCYADGTCAKLAIYCGKIEALEEQVFPAVAELLETAGLNPAESILKYHGGNKAYPQPENSEYEFRTLDNPVSRVRVVLLVQIGKEGWDCHSLAGVILPHASSCPRNMVLQTCCRCLRQVGKEPPGSALIWLNRANADTLNKQLKMQQDISLKQFCSATRPEEKKLSRFSRVEQLRLPPVDFFQLKVRYGIFATEGKSDAGARLANPALLERMDAALVHEQDLEGHELSLFESHAQGGMPQPITFNAWMHSIAKGSFHFLPIEELRKHESALRHIYETITCPCEFGRERLPEYDHAAIESRIRQAFSPQRSISVREEVIPTSANLLQVGRLFSPMTVMDASLYFPEQKEVFSILKADTLPAVNLLSPEELALMGKKRDKGMLISMPNEQHPERNHTYHYLPYHFDSPLERDFFARLIRLKTLEDKKLEFYFNGDDTLTELKIDCFCSQGRSWRYIGKYVPDFVLLSRTPEGSIYKILIMETKGRGYAPLFAERRRFMESEFVKKNNNLFGYNRFDFLYLEDTLPLEKLLALTQQAITQFFDD